MVMVSTTSMRVCVNAAGKMVLTASDVNDIHARYAVAFGKVHLSGERQYKRFLHKKDPRSVLKLRATSTTSPSKRILTRLID